MIEEQIDISKYNKLINSIISKYTYYFEYDDLYQVAVIGLLNAQKNYNTNHNTKFTTYAYFYILGEVNKYLRESNFFKVSKDLVKLNQKVEQARNILAQSTNKNPSDLEIAQYLEIDIKLLEEAKIANTLVDSLDKEKEELNLYSTVAYKDPNMQEDIIDLKSAISSLKDWEQQLLASRYEYGYTQSETSQILGMSQVQVSRKEKEILERLRTRLIA